MGGRRCESVFVRRATLCDARSGYAACGRGGGPHKGVGGDLRMGVMMKGRIFVEIGPVVRF